MILERVPHPSEYVQDERIEVGRARRNRAGERGDHRCLEKGSQREHRRVARRHRGRLRHLAHDSRRRVQPPEPTLRGSAESAPRMSLCGKWRSHLAPDFDPCTLGFRKLSDLICTTNQFDVWQAEDAPVSITAETKRQKVASMATKIACLGWAVASTFGLLYPERRSVYLCARIRSEPRPPCGGTANDRRKA
ncbi:OST-HTH/LOTUS domain-containing protein [Sinorhizobium fredii]